MLLQGKRYKPNVKRQVKVNTLVDKEKRWLFCNSLEEFSDIYSAYLLHWVSGPRVIPNNNELYEFMPIIMHVGKMYELTIS